MDLGWWMAADATGTRNTPSGLAETVTVEAGPKLEG